MNRTIFINRFYWPDTRATGQLLADMAEGLAAKGRPVTVITGQPTAREPLRVSHRGVEILRVSRPVAHEATVRGKAIAFARFAAAASWTLLRRARRGDVVVTLTDPPLFAVLTTWIARLKGAHVVHWIHDIYPEVAAAVSGRRSLRALAPLRNRAWRDADACVTLSKEMASVIAATGVAPGRVHLVPNWAPAEAALGSITQANACRAAWGLDGEFIVGYAGNLGRVHDVDTILETAALLHRNRRIAFVFVGDGPRRAAAEGEVRRRNLGNVRFVAPQPRDQLGATLAAADAHLVTLRPGCEHFVFPSKIYGIAAAGRPVLFIGPADCEMARLVEQDHIGRAFPSGDAAALASAIEELAGDPNQLRHWAAGTAQFTHRFNSQAAIASWQALLQKLETPLRPTPTAPAA